MPLVRMTSVMPAARIRLTGTCVPTFRRFWEVRKWGELRATASTASPRTSGVPHCASHALETRLSSTRRSVLEAHEARGDGDRLRHLLPDAVPGDRAHHRGADHARELGGVRLQRAASPDLHHGDGG